MDRRKLFGMAFCALLAVPASTIAQRSTKVWRIGFLVVSGAGGSGAGPSNVPSAALRQALQELGYVEGNNIVYVAKSAGGNVERLPASAAELVGLDVDVIITTGSESTRAAKQATTSIPIVFLGPSYPVEEQIVSSLARPGANVTGITLAQSDHASKHLQLLRDLVPSLQAVAVVWSPSNQGSVFTLRDIEGAARPLRIRIHSLPISPADERDAILTAIDHLRPGALIVLPSQLVMPRVQRISEQAIRLRVPSISPLKQLTEQGLLLSYGADIRDLEVRVAGYADRILKGAHPSELPVERPTKFQLAINMKTAKALGLTIPQSLMLRADELIQ